MNSHLTGIFFPFFPNSAPSVSVIYGCSISEPGTTLLLEAKMSLRAALLISIEMCLHWHQYSCTFLIPPVRSFAPFPFFLHIPSYLPLLLHLLHPSKLLMQGNPGLHQYNPGLAAHSSLHLWTSWLNMHGKHSAHSFHFAQYD